MRSRGWGLGVAAAALSVLVFVAAAPADDVRRCQGKVATIVGSAGNDVLVGTDRRDVIWAGAGDDAVEAGLGSDVICAGPGDDAVAGGRGNDEIRGGAGDDRLFGGHGDDQIHGESGDDFIHGGLGIDVLEGGAGDDTVDGGYGWDVLDGGHGDDTVSFASSVRSYFPGGGVRVNLGAGRANGDGRDRLRRFQNVVGSAFDDELIGGRRSHRLFGGPGDDRCRGPAAARRSCGRERRSRAPVEVFFHSAGLSPAAAGIVVAAGRRADGITLSFDSAAGLLLVSAGRGVAVHGCGRPGASLDEALCEIGPRPRWVSVDLGRGDDRLQVSGSLRGAGDVRIAGGPGDDELRGGGEDSLLEGGAGADRIFGGSGSDALVAGRDGGGDLLVGGPGGNLLAAPPPCGGGRIVGGSGSDNVSFAELGIQRGVMVASLRAGSAYVRGVRNCRRVQIAADIENLEGSFGPDVLIGDSGPNNLLGQPGADRFHGGGGDDTIDARDGGRDFHIECGPAGAGGGFALVDRGDPAPRGCAGFELGEPIPGLPKP